MNHEIKEITFDDVFPIWRNHLWPDRVSEIEPNSAMCYLGGYDLYNMKTTPTFFGYFVDGKIAGVNSGHMCNDNHYRSRGLFVFDEYRGLGIGTKLLRRTISQGAKEGAVLSWSLPRMQGWHAYHNAGYFLSSPWENTETGLNAYCVYKY